MLILGVVFALLFGGLAAAFGTGLLSFGRMQDGPLAAPDTADPTPTKAPDRKPKKDPTPTPEPVVLEPYESAELPTAKGLEKALSDYVGAGALGKHRGVSVRDLRTGELLYERDGDGSYLPASTTKLLSSAAVLAALGPDHRFETTVVQPQSGEITLVGGGDPLLATQKAWDQRQFALRDRRYPAPATIDELAIETAERLQTDGTKRVELTVDDRLFSEAVAPTWESQYVPTGIVSEISALWVNEGRSNWPYELPRATDPAMEAAQAFEAALQKNGITVERTRRISADSKASSGAEPLAAVESPRLAEIVEHVLLLSDNDGAEVLARHVAIARGEPATFAGTGKAVTDQLRETGIDTTGVKVNDGSGLSRDNRIPPNVLTDLLSVASQGDRPELRAVITGLSVGGFSGSLADRFGYVGGEGAGLVRAKTGTLSGVASLAGIVTTKDGGLLAFDIVSDQGAPIDPRIGIDRAAAALTACGCR